MATTQANDIGSVNQVLGPVVDVEFPGNVPPVNTALKTTNKSLGEEEGNLVLEVAQHLGENRVRCVAMDATDGLTRGQEVVNTGKPIQVPVGSEILGRIVNVTGQPIDEAGPIKSEKTYPIHRDPPPVSYTHLTLPTTTIV